MRRILPRTLRARLTLAFAAVVAIATHQLVDGPWYVITGAIAGVLAGQLAGRSGGQDAGAANAQ